MWPFLWRELFQSVGVPARYNCWFPDAAMVGGFLCSMGQDSQYEVGSTVRCVFKACFTALRKKPIFEISLALSLLPTSSTMPQLGPLFLPLEPAVSSEGSIKCSDVVSNVLFLCNCEVKPSSVAFPSRVCCECADRVTTRVVSCAVLMLS